MPQKNLHTVIRIRNNLLKSTRRIIDLGEPYALALWDSLKVAYVFFFTYLDMLEVVFHGPVKYGL
jgi:hypothetical protein